MKISYQQLLIILLCISRELPAITLYNNSNNSIKYNIFNKKWLEFGSICKPFPLHRGTISAHGSCKINDLNSETSYIITFYDVHNAQHNQRSIIQGKTKKLVFNVPKKLIKELPSFAELNRNCNLIF